MTIKIKQWKDLHKIDQTVDVVGHDLKGRKTKFGIDYNFMLNALELFDRTAAISASKIDDGYDGFEYFVELKGRSDEDIQKELNDLYGIEIAIEN